MNLSESNVFVPRIPAAVTYTAWSIGGFILGCTGSIINIVFSYNCAAALVVVNSALLYAGWDEPFNPKFHLVAGFWIAYALLGIVPVRKRINMELKKL
jgi:hypothetical protein